ncbi:tRNA pseudouridine(55) synthase TruB [Prevotella disiens]|uniref:tRNA pseudouridine synthase B n=1 Tax=Prevotella disiens DNF00882 TaxID=1401075 RepID=A0A096CV56_9BACT|nr:tRNA pseudouridine(55) synthase TruB [Prevotella disiens]KGF49159.1 pseudouridine synthase [Prevotella disiens DNF00882]
MNFKEGVIIPIDKPYGITSFKALAHVRYLCSQAQGGRVKIGHAGTLDPLATGVLILATGKMTKQIENLQTHTKEYVATMQLGATTPSYDMEHEENEKFPTEHITRELIEEKLQDFVGDIEQIPPTYSAVKVNGQRAFDYRRRGDDVVLKPKKIRIDEIEIISFDNEKMQLTVRVVCGKGTYIRALARDLGRTLNSGAYLVALRRTQVGEIKVEQCVNYDHFQEWLNQQNIENIDK